MRKLLGHLAPQSLSGFFWKSGFLCILIFVWHVVLTRLMLKEQVHSYTEIAAEAISVGGPFVVLFMVGSWHQVTAIRALTRRAYYDPLSNLFNRQTFIGRLNRALPNSRSGLLLLLDVDHFKKVNDLHGHAAGDRCIEAIGHRLNWHLRIDDLAGRVGGEEFAVFIPNVSKEHGETVAVRLGLPIGFTDQTKKKHMAVTMSIGAVWTRADQSIEQQLIEADDALYKAKASGRAQLRFSDRPDAISLSLGNTAIVETAAESTPRTNSKINLMAKG